MISVEFCHYDGSTPLDRVLKCAQSFELNIINTSYPEAQKCIMFDDIHSGKSTDEFLRGGVDTLQPHTIYSESIFRPYASKMITILEEKGYVVQEEEGRRFLVKDDTQYGQYKKFLLSYEKKGNKEFSCPALVAASYLCRLGYFGDINLDVLWGDKLKVNNSQLVNFLPNKYLNVEAAARDLVAIVGNGLANKITWVLT